MKTISAKTAFITASVIAFLTLGTSTAQAQWKSDRNSNDRSFRERIEDKLDRERDNRRDERWDSNDRRDEEFNNSRWFGRNRRFDRDDCCRSCKHKHDNRFERRQGRRHDRRHH